jgi:hypothetical protein
MVPLGRVGPTRLPMIGKASTLRTQEGLCCASASAHARAARAAHSHRHRDPPRFNPRQRSSVCDHAAGRRQLIVR